MSAKIFQWWGRIILALGILMATVTPSGVSQAKSSAQSTPRDLANQMLAKLTPEERVGQLFMVTFDGSEITEDSEIYKLIVDYHVGSVNLLADHNNFTADQTSANLLKLTSQLQTVEQEGTNIMHRDPETGRSFNPEFIPLFIGVSQGGGGYPDDQIYTGLSALPSQLAIGATWNTSLAMQTGEVLGTELSALGINLLLGPSLDVYEVSQAGTEDTLGTHTFGGDPFWVGEMAKAYISGLHEGSKGRLAVVTSHFPGSGAADRIPDQEVATVRKSLEQLQQIELAPFAAVTGNASSTETTTDALLVSHIRYLFQGNIRATTRPVSLDATAMSELLGLNQFSTWRSNGGVVISDDLGSRAVRMFYDPSESIFDSRQVARIAFLAGNDILYVNNFTSSGDGGNYATIVKTLDFFAQKYREDRAFAQRVDESVLRILQMKYRLYPTFELDRVVPSADGLSEVGNSRIAFDVAQAAATLISPDTGELSTLLPKGPDQRDRILIISDTQSVRQCARCSEQAVLAVDGLQNAILRLYGPQVGGQVLSDRIKSYSYNDLNSYLTEANAAPGLSTDLSQADWVIFAMLGAESDRPASAALKSLLSDRPDLVRNKRVILFAFGAPYYMDATDISKLTAYYGIYGSSGAFLDVAANILYQDMTPGGYLPVSVPGVGYDLITATSPDPQQVISLALDLPETAASVAAGTQTPEPNLSALTFKVGDTIPLRTGMIVDHNGHPVPDNTIVHFMFTRGGDTTQVIQIEATTFQGIARTSYRIDTDGLLEIRAVSDPAATSELLRLDIPRNEAGIITAIAPTNIPSETPITTPTTSITPTETSDEPARDGRRPNFWAWLLSAFLTGSAGFLIYRWSLARGVSMRWGLRRAMSTVLGGLICYSYLALGLPGSGDWMQNHNLLVPLGATLIGLILGYAGGILWQMISQRNEISRT